MPGWVHLVFCVLIAASIIDEVAMHKSRPGAPLKPGYTFAAFLANVVIGLFGVVLVGALSVGWIMAAVRLFQWLGR